MPIWEVEVTGEWLVKDVEADSEYEAEELAIDYIYRIEPDHLSAWATKVREDEPDEDEDEDEDDGTSD